MQDEQDKRMPQQTDYIYTQKASVRDPFGTRKNVLDKFLLLHIGLRRGLLPCPLPNLPFLSQPSRAVTPVLRQKRRKTDSPRRRALQSHQIIIIYTESKLFMFMPISLSLRHPKGRKEEGKEKKTHKKGRVSGTQIEIVINHTKPKVIF